jgi:hypothetical protein
MSKHPLCLENLTRNWYYDIYNSPQPSRFLEDIFLFVTIRKIKYHPTIVFLPVKPAEIVVLRFTICQM